MQNDKRPTETTSSDPAEAGVTARAAGSEANEPAGSEPAQTEGLPHSDFAMLAARLGQLAAGWAADTLSLPEDLDQPVPLSTVNRFVGQIRDRLNWIEARANGK